MKEHPTAMPFGPGFRTTGGANNGISCHEWIQNGAPGHKQIRIRVAGDLADGVVQLARLVARGFGMQGWPVEILIHPSPWIRAETGSAGAHIMADISALVPDGGSPHQSGETMNHPSASQPIDGWIVFRPTSLPLAFARPNGQAWVLVDADALSARQLAMPQELPWDAAAMAVDIHALSFLNLPRELDLDRHWRRTQRLLSPREMARCRAFTPLGWIAGRFGLDVGPWDIWIEDHFRNHPPMRDMAQSLLRAGHHAAFVVESQPSQGGFPGHWTPPSLMDRGLWRMASGLESLAAGLAQGALARNRKVYVFAPQCPAYAPLLAMAPGLEFRGVLIKAAESPRAAAWSAWGAWLGGASALALGAGEYRPLLPPITPFRPGGSLIFLDPKYATDTTQAPTSLGPNTSILASPAVLARAAESWTSPDTLQSVRHVPEIWNMEEPVHMGTGGTKPQTPAPSTPFALHFPHQEMEKVSQPQDSGQNWRQITLSNHRAPRPPEKGWCPGCGNYSILEHITPFLENGTPSLILGGPGCAGLLGDWLPVPHAICPPGTVIHVAIGVNLAWPEAMTWIVAGDGELGGASLGPLLGLARANNLIKVLFVNNECAASAGGAATPLSGPMDYRNPGTPPLPLAGLVIMAGVGFYARAIDVEVDLLGQAISAAIQHQGFAVIEVWQNCRVHNDANHDDLIDRQLGKRHRLDLRAGRPMSYDCDPEKGMIWKEGRLESLPMNGTKPGNFLIHDPVNTPAHLGVALAEMGLGDPGEPVCFGIFLDRRTLPRISRLAMTESAHKFGSGKSDAWILPDYNEITENQADDPMAEIPGTPEAGQ